MFSSHKHTHTQRYSHGLPNDRDMLGQVCSWAVLLREYHKVSLYELG